MSGQDFYLSQLDVSVDASFATLSGVNTSAFTGDATAAVDISLNTVMTMFQFYTDSIDVNDITNTDLQYKTVYTTSADPLNIDLDTNTEMIASAIHIGASNNHVTYDFVRYLALKLFNTHLGVDLFSNEEPLRTTLNADFKSAFDSVLVGLNDTGTTDNTGSTPSKSILDQVINSVPERLNDITPLAVGSHWYKAPLAAGDKLYFRLTVSAATNQESLTSVSAIQDRIYLIKATLIADEV
jgi:hypothetical protein